jgi:DNA-binding FadR family transcriptional regulator
MTQSPSAAQPSPVSSRKALHVPKAPELVANRIRDLIVAGGLKPGDLLPPEARLMEEHGVSRPTIREAFRILEAERLITVARGARGGAVVHSPDPERIAAYTLMVLRSERTTVAEVFAARRLFEPAVAREVSQTVPDKAVEVLSRVLDVELKAADDTQPLAVAIGRFHRALVELSGNRPLIHLIAAIQSVVELHQAMVIGTYRLHNNKESTRAVTETAFRSQRKLIGLIAKRDGDGAEHHWRKHMDASTKTWTTGYEALTIHDLMQGR